MIVKQSFIASAAAVAMFFSLAAPSLVDNLCESNTEGVA